MLEAHVTNCGKTFSESCTQVVTVLRGTTINLPRITMMLCDDRVRQQLHLCGDLSIGTTYNQREDNHIDHGVGMQGSRRSSDLALNHADMFDRERFNRRTSSIATVEQFEAHLDSTNSTGTKASNRTLATAAYIGLLTIIISFGKLISFSFIMYRCIINDRIICI